MIGRRPCLHPANINMSATLTLFILANSASLLTVAAMGVLVILWSSIGLAREPSQPPCGKQSWKTARIDARAASVHVPPETNIPVSSLEIYVQTAGQEDFPGPYVLAEASASVDVVIFVCRRDNEGNEGKLIA